MSEHVDLEDCIKSIVNRGHVVFNDESNLEDEWPSLKHYFRKRHAPKWLIDMFGLWVEHKMSVTDELRYKEAVTP